MTQYNFSFIANKIIQAIRNRKNALVAKFGTARYLAEVKKRAGPPRVNGQRALIYTGYTLNNMHVRTDILFSSILTDAGFETSVFYCGGAFSTCEFARPKKGALDIGLNCYGCKKFANKLISLDGSGLLRSLLTEKISAEQTNLLNYYISLYEREPLNNLKELELHGVNLHEHIMSTYHRQTLTGPSGLTQLEDSRYRVIGKNVAKAVIYLAHILEHYDPSLVVCTHGIYLNHGPLTTLCRLRGISLTVWGVPYRRGTFYLTKGDTYHRALLPHLNKTHWDVPLSKFEEKRAKNYLESKESGGRDYWSYFGKMKSDSEDRVIKIAKKKQVLVLFTNVDWDAQIFYDGNIFPSQLEWIEHTLVQIRSNIGKHLVIRVHPAEADIFKSRSSIVSSVQNLIQNHRVPNVTLIEPNDCCSSYALMKVSCAALIYGSKISLECAYRGIPTVIVGNSLFRQKEFSYLPESISEYDALITNDISPVEGQVESATRYAHYLYYRVFQECRWADDLFDPYTKFRGLTEAQYQDLADGLVHGTA
ncbi:Capsule polysaccharide biosynthesis [Burkholderiales bacterium]